MELLRLLVFIASFGQLGDCAGSTRMKQPRNAANESQAFKWTNITPKPYLDYHTCYSDLECARLTVPMNYNATSSQTNDNVALGIVRVPARVPVTDPRYGGAIFFNPGGPGNSGVETAIAGGRVFQTMFDAAYANNSSTYVVNTTDALYFDIIGWDPRGVQYTTPFYTCQQNPTSQIVQYLQGQQQLLTTPEGNFDYLWAQYSSLNQGCVYDPVSNPEGSKIAPYTSTSFVALDMVEIVEQHGQWREKQAHTSQQKQRLKYQKGEEPLLYVGVSYGTELGQVFASMQPHRVKRMFLNGVIDVEDYMSGALLRGLSDADEVMEHCFEYCALAGQEACGLYNGSTAQDTRNRLLAIVSDLQANGPVFVPRHRSVDGAVVTLSDIFSNAYLALYTPVTSFETFAAAVGPLSQRNGTAFVDTYKADSVTIFQSDTYESPSVIIDASDPDSDTHAWASSSQVRNAIACPEAWIRRDKAEFEQFLKHCQKQSFWGAPSYVTGYMGCISTFTLNTTWSFLWNHPVGSEVTAHPILFGSNTYDPITPLRNAHVSKSKFKGSFLLVNDGDGHTVLSNPSLEHAQLVRKYFQTGELPPPDQPATLPLERPILGSAGPKTAPLARNASLEEQVLVKALESVINLV